MILTSSTVQARPSSQSCQLSYQCTEEKIDCIFLSSLRWHKGAAQRPCLTFHSPILARAHHVILCNHVPRMQIVPRPTYRSDSYFCRIGAGYETIHKTALPFANRVIACYRITGRDSNSMVPKTSVHNCCM